MKIDVPVLDGEEWWASQATDDTDSVIRSLLDLTISCVELNIKLEESKQLQAELSLHNETHNIELEIDKWLNFCASLRDAEILEMANEVSSMLRVYVDKHLK